MSWNWEGAVRLSVLFRIACACLLGGLVGCSPQLGLQQCQSTAECLDKGLQDAVCTPDHYCESGYSAECRDMLVGGPLESDSILIAMMTRLEGTSADLGKVATQAARLALTEMVTSASALAVSPSKSPRKVRLLLCNDGVSAGDSVRIAKRLVNDLGIQVIMGPFNSGYTLEVARQVTIPAGVLMLNPFSVTPLLTDLPDQGLVWRTSISNKPEGPGMALLAKQLEGRLRKDGKLGATAPLVVATVARDDTYGRGIVDDFNTEWTALHSGAAGDVVLRPFLVSQTGQGLYSFDTSKLQAENPHLVILAGTQEMVSNVMAPLEKLKLTRPPFYFASEGTKAPSLATAVWTDPTDLRDRTRVIAPTVPALPYSLLRNRIRQQYSPDMEIPDGYGVANSYDAMYLLAYGLALLGDGPVTGAGLAAQLKSMSAKGGVVVNAGPSDLALGYRTLQAKRQIDFKGVSGELDFDPNTGESKGAFDILCVKGTAGFEPLTTKIEASDTPHLAALNPVPSTADQFEGCVAK